MAGALLAALAGAWVLAVTVSGAADMTAVRVIALVVVLVPLAVFASYAVWRARVESLARGPGPIMVLPFVDNTRRTADPALARELEAAFEAHLVRTRLYGETAVPSTGQPDDFLTVVEAAGDQLRGAWAAASRFVRLFAPVTAFQVTCTLQTPLAGSRPTVVVELSRLPRTSLAPLVVDGATWDRAVERAAHAVAAQVLPRTVQCGRAPWRTWEGYRIPFELFHAYQRFQALRSARHFDDAMAALRLALREDPRNLAMRLEMGKMQERLQMYLDALLTYDDIVSLAARRDGVLAAWWRPGGEDQPWSDRGGSRGLAPDDPTILVARYRHALLLGLGREVAGQWWGRPERCGGDHRSSREERRAHLRRALRTRFERRYRPLGVLPPEEAGPDVLGDLRKGNEDDGEQSRLRGELAERASELFTTLSHLEFERLADDYVHISRQERTRARRNGPPTPDCESFMRWRASSGDGRPVSWVTGLPRRSGRLASAEQDYVLPREALLLGLPWAVLRRASTQRTTPPTTAGTPARSLLAPDQPSFDGARELLRSGRTVEAKLLGAVVDRLTGGPLRTWRAHFNGACVLALPLLTASSDDDGRATDSAATAIAELERAVMCADGLFLARQREWLLTEDPDLDRLRGRPEFQDFEATTFGSIGAAVQRGPQIHTWQQSTYVARFISAAAAEMAALWGRRLTGQNGGDDDRTRWLDEEMAGWRLAERLAIDYLDPRTRQDVARHIATAGRLPPLRGPHVEHPRFSHDVLERRLVSMNGGGESQLLATHRAVRSRDVTERTAEAIRLSTTRLDLLARALRQGRGGCCSLARPFVLDREERVMRLRVGTWATRRGERNLPDEAAWCRVSRDRWQALSAWFDDDAFPVLPLAARHLVLRAALLRHP